MADTLSRLFAPTSSNGTTLVTSNPQTINGSNTTVATAIFGLTGSVEVLRLWAQITTDLGSNHTAAAWRLNDQSAQVDITLSTGTTLSSKKAGSILAKKGLAAAALVLIDNAAGAIAEPTTLETTYFGPFVITKKTTATTNIEYVYATTTSPTTGALLHFVEYRPVSNDGALIAL